MNFKVWGPWNTEKYCRPSWLTEKKIFRILETLKFLKQEQFDLGDSLLTVSALKLFLFSICIPSFFLLYTRKWEWGGQDPPLLLALFISVKVQAVLGFFKRCLERKKEEYFTKCFSVYMQNVLELQCSVNDLDEVDRRLQNKKKNILLHNIYIIFS